MQALKRAISVSDLRDYARGRLPKAVFDFVDGAAEEELTAKQNLADLAAVRFLPRYPANVGERDTRISLFGRDFGLPIFISPTGLAALVWPQADVHLAKAASAFNIPFIISSSSSVRLEDITAAAPGANVWFQVYMYRDREIVKSLMTRCRLAGIDTLVVTVDVPVLGQRRRDLANHFSVPLRPTVRMAVDSLRCFSWSLGILRFGIPKMQNLIDYGTGRDLVSLQKLMTSIMDPSVNWDSLQWLRDNWRGRLVVKGILASEDAVEAHKRGYDAIFVSNHGGRQLDGSVSSISALAKIHPAVGTKIPLLMDSGIRSGVDVAKSMATGAAAVGLGRATLFGAAARGEAGVRQVLTIVRDEFERALALLGCQKAAGLDGRFLA